MLVALTVIFNGFHKEQIQKSQCKAQASAEANVLVLLLPEPSTLTR